MSPTKTRAQENAPRTTPVLSSQHRTASCMQVEMPLGGVLLDRAGIGMAWSERKTRKIARVEECAVPAAIAIRLACSRAIENRED